MISSRKVHLPIRSKLSLAGSQDLDGVFESGNLIDEFLI